MRTTPRMKRIVQGWVLLAGVVAMGAVAQHVRQTQAVPAAKSQQRPQTRPQSAHQLAEAAKARAAKVNFARRTVKGQTATMQAVAHFVPEVVTTLAGGGFNPSGDGIPATDASFSSLYGVAVDSQGNTYVSEFFYGGVIRRIDASTGTIRTVVGVSSGGCCGGGEVKKPQKKLGKKNDAVLGTQLSLAGPKGLAIGPDDSVYFADYYASLVYKLDTQGMVTIVAGQYNSYGYSGDGGPATQAQLNSPASVAVDASGNVYIADTTNSVIRKVNASDGTISTVAGTGTSDFGGDGSAATAAMLSFPSALAIDTTGNLLIVDAGNDVVRKVNGATGIITTIAGTPQNYGDSGDGGLATNALLSSPTGIAVDAAGQIYISDGARVRKIAADGTISTVAGDPSQPSYFGYNGDGEPATKTALGQIDSVAVDANGTLYVASNSYGRVLKLGPNGEIDFGTVSKAQTVTQTLLLTNTGTVDLHLIAPVSMTGDSVFSLLPSTTTNGCQVAAPVAPGASCSLTISFTPTDVTTYSATLVVTDDAVGGTQTTDIFGEGVLPPTDTTLTLSTQAANIGDPVTFTATVVPDSGTGPIPTGTVLFVDDNTGTTLAQANLDGSGTATVTTSSIPVGEYYVDAQYQGSTSYAPSSFSGLDLTVSAKIATITLTSSLPVVGTTTPFTLTAAVSSTQGTPTGNVEFRVGSNLVGITSVQGGHATVNVTAPTPGNFTAQAKYVGDAQFGPAISNPVPLTVHGPILQFTPGATVTIAGIPSDDNHGGYSDTGSAVSSAFHTPSGVSTDGAGNIYVADEQNNIIRRIAPDGSMTIAAGVPYAGSIYSTRFGGDGGLATQAYLDNPIATVVNAAGDLFIADYSNNVVRRVDAVTGIISTYAGDASNHGQNTTSGVATHVAIGHPSALALDAAGNLYIADLGNNLVRKVDTAGNLTTVAGRLGFAPSGNPTSGQPATSTTLNAPMGVGIDPSGALYIAESNWNVIRKVDASGNLVIVAGGNYNVQQGTEGLATSVNITRPQQIVFDLAGNYYFAEEGNYNLIRKVDPSGYMTTVMGYPGTPSNFYHFDPLGAPATRIATVGASGVAIDSQGSLLVTDDFNQTVLRAGANGAVVFGPQDAGATSPAQTVTLFNAGDQPITFNSNPYVVNGDYLVGTSSVTPCNFSASVAPGASCHVDVSYKNQGNGLTGSVVFTGNMGTATINLTTLATPAASTTTMYASSQAINAGDTELFIAVVNVGGSPASGDVAFYDGTTLLGTGTITSGYAYIQTTTLSQGAHQITAHYLGDGYYGASVSDPTEVDVSGAASTMTLTASASTVSFGSAVTFTATVRSGSTGVPTGTVTFLSDGSAIGTRTVSSSGVATLTTTSLPVGSHSITSTYDGGTAFAGSSAGPIGVQVTSGGGGGGGAFLPDYVVQASGLPVTIHRGESKTVVLDYQLLNNTGTTITPTCGTLPSYATCSFSPAFVILSGPITDQTVTLTISTTALPVAPGARVARGAAIKVGGATVGVLKQ